MRTPWFTALAPFVAVALYGAALGTDHWVKWEEANAEAHIGLLRYKYTHEPKATDVHGTGWTMDVDCSITSDEEKCKTFVRVAIAVVALTGLSALLLLAAVRKSVFGPGIAVNLFFWAFVFSAVPCILFAATYKRVRLPNTPVDANNTDHAPEDADFFEDELLQTQTARRAHDLGLIDMQGNHDEQAGAAAVGHAPPPPPPPLLGDDVNEASYTLQWSFFLYCAGAAVAMLTLCHHIATCSKRKYEEL